jgi:hypothetical protein
VARKLLLTAATRQHTAAMQRMLKLHYMRQHVDAATLEAVLKALLATILCHQDHDFVVQLCNLPAAAMLTLQAVTALLHAADIWSILRHSVGSAACSCFVCAASSTTAQM